MTNSLRIALVLVTFGAIQLPTVATAATKLTIVGSKGDVDAKKKGTRAGGKMYTKRSNRSVTYAYAWVRVENINGGEKTDTKERQFVRSFGCYNDDAGHVIARQLGGGVEKLNLWPQNSNINQKSFNQWEQRIVDYVKDTRNNPLGVKVELTFSYATPGKPERARSVTYKVYYGKDFKKTNVKTFPNPKGDCCL